MEKIFLGGMSRFMSSYTKVYDGFQENLKKMSSPLVLEKVLLIELKID